MSLIDFLKEENAERKKRRKEQKANKKKVRTPEQKRYRIYAFITVLLIIFGVFFSTCNTNGEPFTWNKIIGITNEMIVELEKDIDETGLFPKGKISELDWESCNNVLKDSGINFDTQDDSFVQYESFSLTDRQVGALAKKMLADLDNSVIKNVCDLKIYAVGEQFYMRSVVYIDLSTMIVGAELPSVYLTSTSKVEILSNSLVCMSNQVLINNLSPEVSSEIISVFDKNSSTKISTIAGEIISTSITLFGESVGMEMQLRHGYIDFSC